MGKGVDSKVAIVKRQIFFLFSFSFSSLFFPGQGRSTYVSRLPSFSYISTKVVDLHSLEYYHRITSCSLQLQNG